MSASRKPDKHGATPRNIYIVNRKTSVRLEQVMWDALADIANAEGKTLFELINEIHQDHAGANLSSAIRVFIVEHYRAALRNFRPGHFR
jgi:predicted DNA-binding ribbon-helix-helix protein